MSLLLTGILLAALALALGLLLAVTWLEARDVQRRSAAQGRLCECTDGARIQALARCPRCGGTGWRA